MQYYTLLCFYISLAQVGVKGGGTACEDIDPVACSSMAKQNANLCAEPVLAQSACPKYCGNCPTTCYNCNTTSSDVSMCNTVTCDKNKKCLIEIITTKGNGQHGQVTYSLGCASENYCNTGTKRTLHSRSLTVQCCDRDLCNVPVTTTLPSQPNTITTTSIKTTTETTIQTTTMTTALTTVVDHCVSNPCAHGTCSSSVNSYICSCEQSWIGSNCETPDPCTKSPCYNGFCSSFENGTLFCKCNSGYTGKLCDFAHNSCDDNPCVHGTCTPSGRHFICYCEHGWIGTTCNSLIDQCASNPCLHGQCTSDLMSYKCNCTTGYVGNHCDKACSRDVLVKIDQTLLSNFYAPSTRQFLQNLVTKMHIGSNGIYVGVSTFYESGVAFGWGLGWITNKISLLNAIGNLPHQPISGLPDIYQPVHSLYIHATGGHGGRNDVPDVALIITGPFKNSQYIDKSEIDRINTVMPIVTIGVGNVNTQMLGSIAKDSSHALNVRSVNDLVDNDFVDKVLNILCL